MIKHYIHHLNYQDHLQNFQMLAKHWELDGVWCVVIDSLYCMSQ